MSTFKVGDKVRCISGAGGLRDGAQKDMVGLDKAEPEWLAYRFELVERPSKVRTREQVLADRRKELLDGVVANHTAGIKVPQEWIEELYCGFR